MPPDEGKCEFIVPNGELSSSGIYYEVTVPTGEDIVARIHSICLNGPTGVRVIKASGVVSGITLQQHSPTSDASTTCTHQCSFRVKGLEGVFLPMEETVGEIISTGLQISAYPEVPSGTWLPLSSKVEGVVSGSIIGASQVLVTLGVYKVDCHKLQRSVNQHGKDTVLAQVPMPRLIFTTLSPSGQRRRIRFKNKTPLNVPEFPSPSGHLLRSKKKKKKALSHSTLKEEEASVRLKMETLSLNAPEVPTPRLTPKSCFPSGRRYRITMATLSHFVRSPVVVPAPELHQ